ncbi:hypothetical protein GCM10027418_22240 [Mariniluteicoccus endophyticus]
MADESTQLRKGALEIAVLAILRGGPRYGGELVARLSGLPGLDAGTGTVYPLLTRLRTAGSVDTHWEESPSGPPRKYYSLTPAGHARLDALGAAWRELSASLTSLLGE